MLLSLLVSPPNTKKSPLTHCFHLYDLEKQNFFDRLKITGSQNAANIFFPLPRMPLKRNSINPKIHCKNATEKTHSPSAAHTLTPPRIHLKTPNKKPPF